MTETKVPSSPATETKVPSDSSAPEIKVPSAQRIQSQKTYIISNIQIMNVETKKIILTLVMQEVGNDAIMGDSKSGSWVDINLDKCSEINPAVIGQIYNIVKARSDALNAPIGADMGRHGAGDDATRATGQIPAAKSVPSVVKSPGFASFSPKAKLVSKPAPKTVAKPTVKSTTKPAAKSTVKTSAKV